MYEGNLLIMLIVLTVGLLENIKLPQIFQIQIQINLILDKNLILVIAPDIEF